MNKLQWWITVVFLSLLYFLVGSIAIPGTFNLGTWQYWAFFILLIGVLTSSKKEHEE